MPAEDAVSRRPARMGFKGSRGFLGSRPTGAAASASLLLPLADMTKTLLRLDISMSFPRWEPLAPSRRG